MIKAMGTAPLGDDVLGDDPTVIKFEQIAAELEILNDQMRIRPPFFHASEPFVGRKIFEFVFRGRP